MPSNLTAAPLPSVASVLAFDPAGRTSSRRRASESTAQAEYFAEYFAAVDAEAADLAADLGITYRQLCRNDDFFYHAHLMRDIEAAYRKSPKKGRQVVLQIVMDQWHMGYDDGIDDAALKHRLEAGGRR